MSLSQLDPLARAELETLGQHWRDVYPAGNTFQLDVTAAITRFREAGMIDGADAGLLYVRVCRFANGESDSLGFDA